MAPSVKVVCPSCGSGLRISKPSLIGKRVACPSCKKPFRIEVSTKKARELESAVAASSGKSGLIITHGKSSKSEAEYDTIIPLEEEGGKSSGKSTVSVCAARQATSGSEGVAAVRRLGLDPVCRRRLAI